MSVEQHEIVEQAINIDPVLEAVWVSATDLVGKRSTDSSGLVFELDFRGIGGQRQTLELTGPYGKEAEMRLPTGELMYIAILRRRRP